MAEERTVFVGGAPPFSPIVGASIPSRQEALEVVCERIEGRENKVSKLSEGPSEQCEVRLKPKHNIFLSHSGAQKDFTRHLSIALKKACYVPFLDANADSLTKGEKWFPTLIEAARQCRVAILVLSDEFFTRSKWPMLELNVFAKSENPDLKILPLFLKISFENFEKARKERKWLKKWEEMKQSDDRMKLNEWEQALSVITKYGAMSYNDNEGEPAFIEKVVEAICKLVEPDVKFNVPDNGSLKHLCQPILQKLEEIAPSPKYKVRVMGLYGIGGIGKTTISRAVCNEKLKDYGGKVCHIEFGSKNSLELQKSILKELMGMDTTTLDKNHDKLNDYLKNGMKEQKVFVVLDNVQGHDVDEVKKYLNIEHNDKSVVLVTSRSLDILNQQLLIGVSNCMEVPELNEKSAIEAFSYYLGWEISTNKEMIIKKYVAKCCFMKKGGVTSTFEEKSGKQYLPLAVKVLASQLQSNISEDLDLESYMEKYLEKLNIEGFNILRERMHPIYSILRHGYDALCLEDQHIFLDLALLWTPRWRSWKFELEYMWKWMCGIHRKTREDMKDCVNALMSNGLLEMVVDPNGLKCNIHDLYIDFAEAEVRTGPFEERRFLIDKAGMEVPFELLKYPPGVCWSSLKRLVIQHSKVGSFSKAKLKHCLNVEVLNLLGCKNLVEIDIGSLENLRSMEIFACGKLVISNQGVEKLKNLTFIYMADCHIGFDLNFLTGLKKLQVLIIQNFLGLENLPNAFTELKVLRELNVEACINLKTLGDIKALTALKTLNVASCRSLKELPNDLSGLTNLEELNIEGCNNLETLGGAGALRALKQLDAQYCTSLKELPNDLSGLTNLEELNIKGCSNLETLGDVGALRALKQLDVEYCTSLKELPCDLSGLTNLEKLNIGSCKNLETLSDVGALKALKQLNVEYCTNLKALPNNLSGLMNLEELNIEGCNNLKTLGDVEALIALKRLDARYCTSLKKLPNDLRGLTNLEKLNIGACSNLETFGDVGALRALKQLNAQYCTSLKGLPNDLSGLTNLEELNIGVCKNLETLGDVGALRALKQLNAQYCTSLKALPNKLSGLMNLEELNIEGCNNLETLGDVGALIALKRLDVRYCTSLKKLPNDLRGLTNLEELNIGACSNLETLGDVGALRALKRLDARYCTSLKALPNNLSGLTNLEELNIWKCSNLETLGDVGALRALKRLDAQYCTSLKGLPNNLSGLTNLEELNIRDCTNLQTLGDVQALRALKRLDAEYCTSLKALPNDLSSLMNLMELNIQDCNNLQTLGGVGALRALKRLDTRYCTSLKGLPNDLSGLTNLEELNIEGCSNLETLGDVGALRALKRLDGRYCTSLKELPNNRFYWRTGSQSHDMNALEPSLNPLEFDSNKSTMRDCKGGSHQSEDPLFSSSNPPNDPRLQMDWDWIGMPTPEMDLQTPEVDLVTPEEELWSRNVLNLEEELFLEEVAKIDNILELPMDSVFLPSITYNGPSSLSSCIIVRCCFNAKERSFEFLFNNREDMARVVGVGLEFAKAVLIEGWEVHVKEMTEDDWRSQGWNTSQSCLTMTYRLLSIQVEESSSHGTNDRDVVFQRPLLWDLAKYFTLQETIAILQKKRIFAQSANTGGASSSNPQGSSNENDQGYDGSYGSVFFTAFRKWFPHERKENGEDNEEGRGRRNNQLEDPSNLETRPASANATVSVELMKGGSFDDMVGVDTTVEQKLKSTKNTIASNLKFTFTNQDGEKYIQITVGRLTFALHPFDDANAGESYRVVWSHRDPNVSFGLEGNNAEYGEVVRDSFKHLDIDTMTTTTKSSQTIEKKKGKDNLVRGEASGAPHGFGMRGAIERKNKTEDNVIQLLETSFEGSREQTTDGLWFNVHDDEHGVGCKYFFHPQNIEWPLSPMFKVQQVMFQAKWNAYGNMPFVEYTLKASRILQEVKVETYKAPEIDKKRKKTRQWGLGCCTSVDAVQALKLYKQTFGKKILVNHEMSHLDGKTHEVRERVGVQNGLSYLSKTRGGTREQYAWGSSELLKFPSTSL